jgi:hypothetical protein
MNIFGKIFLNHKTGFQGFEKVIVFENGKPFYVIQKKGKIKFNLPKGEYNILTPVKKLNSPITYKVTSKRKRENYFYTPPEQGLKVIIGDNANKASIKPLEGIILIDQKYKNDFPSFVFTYLLYHEIGHYHYDTEEFCDEYARDRMLSEGYNISQVVEASKMTLNDKHDRFRNCLENAKKIRINEK